MFSKRGMLRIHSLKSGHGEYVSEDLLSSDEIHELKVNHWFHFKNAKTDSLNQSILLEKGGYVKDM